MRDEKQIMKEDLRKKLSTVPETSGVYIFSDKREKVIYVGKAKSLKHRLKSYFHAPRAHDLKTTSLMKTAADFSFIVTENEVEALVLESNLIKQYKPRFNVILRDDKNYPYLKVTVDEEWPRIEIVRRYKQDGAVYIGPYVSSKSMREALDFIRKTFPIRTCRYRLDNLTRSCIQYQMGYCSAPCDDLISRKEYGKIVNEVIEFLKGNRQNLLNILSERMQSFSEKLMFEEAAVVRDRLRLIKRAWESQKVVAPELGDMDVVGYYQSDSEGMFNIFFVRNGVLIGVKDFYIRNSHGFPLKRLICSFIEQFYNKEILPPPEVLVREKPEHLAPLKKWLKGRRGRTVRISIPSDKKKIDLMGMAEENAMISLGQKRGVSSLTVLKELTERLDLPRIPLNIGAFDISTTFGSESVGGFVYWREGRFVKEFYRHIRIRTVDGMDDYSMMREAIQRVFTNIRDDLPDLVVIDGGRGQLDAALKALRCHILTFDKNRLKEVRKSNQNEDNVKCQDVTPMVIAVAKNPDRVFIPGRKDQVSLENGNQSSLLPRKIRDEVHRFAITYHRKLRDKRLMKSPLERVRGVSLKRRLALLRRFRSIEAIRDATVEEIASLKGFNRKLAESILKELRK